VDGDGRFLVSAVEENEGESRREAYENENRSNEQSFSI
jgi:hypothetical protein